MLGKKTKREIEDEIYEQHPDLEVIKRGGSRTARGLKSVGKYLIMNGAAGIPIALGVRGLLPSAIDTKSNFEDNINEPVFKKLQEKAGDNYGGEAGFFDGTDGGAYYNHLNNKVYIGNRSVGGTNSKTLAHEMGHWDIHNGKGIGTAMQKIRVSPAYAISSGLLTSGNSIHSGISLSKDKLLGKKSSLFKRYKAGGGALLAELPTLWSEADASIRGRKLYKVSGGTEVGKYNKQMASAYGTYLLGTAGKVAANWILSKLVKELGINNYLAKSEVEKVAYLTKLLSKEPQYKGMSSKELYKIAYDRMKVLDKELADDRKGWKRLILR